MKCYNEISNFEINKLIALTIEGVDFDTAGNAKYAVDCFIKSIDGESVNVLWIGNGEYSLFNPCNNPADMWPLIVDSKISILPWNEQMWQAWFTDSGLDGIKHRVFDKNPLRAAAIVYLMIKDEK